MSELEATLQICRDLKSEVQALSIRVASLEGKADMSKMVIQWIVFPLVTILGAIVGVKVILPTF